MGCLRWSWKVFVYTTLGGDFYLDVCVVLYIIKDHSLSVTGFTLFIFICVSAYVV